MNYKAKIGAATAIASGGTLTPMIVVDALVGGIGVGLEAGIGASATAVLWDYYGIL